MSGFYVHHPSLTRASKGATASTANVGSSADEIAGSTPDAIQLHPGWESSAALQKCLTAWQRRLHDLAYEIQTIGLNLGASNEAYKKADQKLVKELEKLSSQIADGAK